MNILSCQLLRHSKWIVGEMLLSFTHIYAAHYFGVFISINICNIILCKENVPKLVTSNDSIQPRSHSEVLHGQRQGGPLYGDVSEYIYI